MNTETTALSGEASKLAVLGLLSIAPNHGYGLRAILESWQVHRWADIKYGSIYAALKRFDAADLVETVGVDSERGPNRTTYRITPSGRRALADMTRRAWIEPPRWTLTTDLALMFLALDWMGAPVLERDELRELLEQRTARIQSRIDELTTASEQAVAQTEFTPLQGLQRAHFDHGLRLLQAELEWSRSVSDALDRGEFDVTPPSPRAGRATSSARRPRR